MCVGESERAREVAHERERERERVQREKEHEKERARRENKRGGEREIATERQRECVCAQCFVT